MVTGTENKFKEIKALSFNNANLKQLKKLHKSDLGI